MPSWFTKAYWNAFTLWHARDEARLPYQSMDELTAIQNRRVQAMVAHAYETVPYYRDVMDNAGWCPKDFQTAADLMRLPVVTSAQLAAAPERFLSRRYATRDGVQLQSSATSGQPKEIRHDIASVFFSLAYGHRERIVLAHFTGRPDPALANHPAQPVPSPWLGAGPSHPRRATAFSAVGSLRRGQRLG
ncbi:MAG: hypothetical protein ABSA52_16830 [Candidatus Binatia bacterium]|jgi:hypothetical protein